ncbi:MAG: thiamine pyrophosphate-binding protein [Candidatus Freyarchaeota archaeon]
MNGWEAVIETLKAEKVKFVFGLPTLDLMAYLRDTPEIKPIQVRHEASGVFMAMAYARLTGRPGVVYASPGPGVANMTPGILEAYAACTPLIAPCPGVSLETEGMGAFQETDQVSLFKPITKWSVRVPRADRIPWFMHRAFTLAINGKPGPIFLEIPSNVASMEVKSPKYTPAKRIRVRGDPELIKEAVNLILKAERPVVVAGGGVVLSRAFPELREFVELLGIPILTTASGRGSIPEDHPLALGLVGLYRTNLGKKIYQEADLLINIGSRFEEFQSGNWKYFPEEAKYIQVDIDPFEIGRNWMPDVGIVGDAKLVLRDLIQGIREKVKKEKLEEMPRVKELVEAKEEYEAEIESECMTDAIPIKTKRVIRELNKVFGKNTILVNENGMQDLWSYYCPYYKVLDVGGCIPPAEQTCMGLGVVGAIGAKLTEPDKKVVCTAGDGAFQMYSQDVPTAVQYNAPVTWIILNSFSLGWVKWGQLKLLGKATACEYTVQPDFTKFAEANKCYGERIQKPAEIKPALERALKANEEGTPAILDFIIDPEDCHEGFKEFHRVAWGMPV